MVHEKKDGKFWSAMFRRSHPERNHTKSIGINDLEIFRQLRVRSVIGDYQSTVGNISCLYCTINKMNHCD